MTKNPFLNALAGLAYIFAVASFMFYVAPRIPIEDTVLIPVAVLSLFVFSAAMMGYIFILEPLRLFFDGNKSEAVRFFLKTLVSFAAAAVLLVSLGLYFVSRL
jgi:hypothetical protein